jgi:hypothetical protein
MACIGLGQQLQVGFDDQKLSPLTWHAWLHPRRSAWRYQQSLILQKARTLSRYCKRYDLQ